MYERLDPPPPHLLLPLGVYVVKTPCVFADQPSANMPLVIEESTGALVESAADYLCIGIYLCISIPR